MVSRECMGKNLTSLTHSKWHADVTKLAPWKVLIPTRERSRDRLQALAISFFPFPFCFAFPYCFLIVFYLGICFLFFSSGTSPISEPLVFLPSPVNCWALSDRSLKLPSNSCATTSAHLWSSALVSSSSSGFLHAPFPAFLTGEIISIPLVLASSLSNASPLRYLLRLVLPTRSWPINTILVRLS